MKRLNFAIVVHAHQPVDNFHHVFKNAYQLSYRPFLEVLKKFPEVKINLHISGSLLDWLLENEPGYIDELRDLSNCGQINFLGGGYYEPILVLLHDEDKKGQISYMKEKIKQLFGVTPRGIWLTERIWEPSLPKPLREAGVDFVIVDDKHFEIAGFDIESLDGYYLTEEQGYNIAIFPGSKFLRYSMPFKEVKETINYLREKLDQGIKSITYADDMEKFGFWPQTYHWVYEEGWLEKFFQELIAHKDWIKLVHLEEILEDLPPSGRVYLPCASYSEMMEWSHNMFRNFLAKYEEANNIHKKMFFLSKRLRGMKPKHQPEMEEAKKYLYKAQNNDVYWHGIFGGLYLANLRDNAYRYLILAEKILDKLQKINYPQREDFDFDLDGQKEIIYKNNVFSLYFAPHRGGTIEEWDYRKADINLVNTLTRRKEDYHQKILEKVNVKLNHKSNVQPASIHDLEFNNQGLEEEIIYDNYLKSCWIDHIFGSDLNYEELKTNKLKEAISLYDKLYRINGKNNSLSFRYQDEKIGLCKEIKLKDERIDFHHLCFVEEGNFYGIEFNFLLYDSKLINLTQPLKEKEIILNDEWHNLAYKFSFDQPPYFFSYPIQTISYSEKGFERTHQGMSLFFIWRIKEEELDLSFSFSVRRK